MHGDYKSKFYELLEKDSSFRIDHRNIQTLVVETFFERTIPKNNE